MLGVSSPGSWVGLLVNSSAARRLLHRSRSRLDALATRYSTHHQPPHRAQVSLRAKPKPTRLHRHSPTPARLVSTMSAKPPPTDLPMHPFASAQDLETFLEREHTTLAGFYLKFAKKSSGIPSVSAADAVEVALCFGWIDGRANAFDENWWLVRYTPRRAKSIWSQKNVNTVQRLIADGRMRPAGVAAVDAAKVDGRWDRAYDGPASITVPEDLATALAAEPAAQTFFEGLNKSDRYSVLHRVQTAAPGRRAGRIEAMVLGLAKGECPGVSGGGKSDTKAKPKAKKKTESKSGRVQKAAVAKPSTSRGSDTRLADGSGRQLRPRKSRD